MPKLTQTLMDQFMHMKPNPNSNPSSPKSPLAKSSSASGPGSSHVHHDHRRPPFKKIAEETLQAIEFGSYTLSGATHDLRTTTANMRSNTQFYPHDSMLAQYSSTQPPQPSITTISFFEVSTLDAAALLQKSDSLSGRIGVLNFASAKNPGGGFIRGAQAQEESIARASNLYPSLMTSTAQQFYSLHNKNPKNGFYSHAMIYSPAVVIFRDDSGGWVEPNIVDVLTSPAVNAGVVRKHYENDRDTEKFIAKVMKERMARILYLFEKEGVRHLVLGSFGTGVFRNDVPMVGRLWAELLAIPGARFGESFNSVVFGILGRRTFDEFKEAFNQTVSRFQEE